MAVMDLVAVGILLFFVSISLFFGSILLYRFGENDMIAGNAEASSSLNTIKSSLHAFNSWFPFIFVGFLVAIAIGAYFTEAHPVFMVVSIILLVIFLAISGILVNMFTEFASASQFTPIINEYGNIVRIWDYMPYLLLVSSIIIIIVLYGKRSSNEPVY